MQYTVNMGFVPHMRVPGTFYVNDKLKDLLFEELQQHVSRGEVNCSASYVQTAVGQLSTPQQCCSSYSNLIAPSSTLQLLEITAALPMVVGNAATSSQLHPLLTDRLDRPSMPLLILYVLLPCLAVQHGGFLPAVKQLANVAALPGIVKVDPLYCSCSCNQELGNLCRGMKCWL